MSPHPSTGKVCSGKTKQLVNIAITQHTQFSNEIRLCNPLNTLIVFDDLTDISHYGFFLGNGLTE